MIKSRIHSPGFMPLLIECTNDADTGDILPQDNIHPVEKSLQFFKNGGSLPHDQQGGEQHKAGPAEDQHTHLRVDSKRQRNAQYADHRYWQDHLNEIYKGLLDDIHIIQGTGDHGCCSEGFKIRCGKREGSVIDCLAQVAAKVS